MQKWLNSTKTLERLKRRLICYAVSFVSYYICNVQSCFPPLFHFHRPGFPLPRQLAKELQLELNKLQGVRNDGIDLGTVGAALEGNDSQDPIRKHGHQAASMPDDSLDPTLEGTGEVGDSQHAPDSPPAVPEDGDSQKAAPALGGSDSGAASMEQVAHPNSTDPAGMDSDNLPSTDVNNDSEGPVTLDGYEGSVIGVDEDEMNMDDINDTNLLGMLQSQIGVIAPCI